MRRKTRQVRIGGVAVGGGATVSVQSMTKTDTCDIRSTLRQIRALEKAGCDIVRIAVKDVKACEAFREIMKSSRLPVEADVHFHPEIALHAIEYGADGIRLNPGNIDIKKKRRDIRRIVTRAKERRIPIRIGANSGSSVQARSCTQAGRMVASIKGYTRLFEDMDFRDIMISAKSSDVRETVEANRAIARICDYPIHLGVTAAGPCEESIVKSAIGIGALLVDGIGDTIRVSMTGDPVQEVVAGRKILSALSLRNEGIEIISCPTCGRCEIDLEKIVNEFKRRGQTLTCNRGQTLTCSRTSDQGLTPIKVTPIKVAIMGCVVNGPGEAKHADIGIAAGRHSGILFKRGKMVKRIAEKDFVKVLLQEVSKIIKLDERIAFSV